MVRLDNLTVTYQEHPALHHVSGLFSPGSMTAVVGPNGSGKSTLLKGIAGLLPLHGGKIHGALTVSILPKHIAYLPQFNAIDRSFPLNVRDCVLLGCWGSAGAWGSITTAMLARADAALRAVGLEGFERRSLDSLSGGQLQRAMFARMLMQDAQLLLLDEPFNAIDTKTCNDLLQLLRLWQRQQRTVIAVLHDQTQVRQYFPETLLLAREVVSWGATAAVLTEHNLHRAHTMTEAWDELADSCELDAQALQQVMS
jgi:zinc/manganese transport system ATP-binding protein